MARKSPFFSHIHNFMKVADKLQRIEELTENLSLPKYNSLKINYLARLITDTELHVNHCETCKKNEVLLTNMIEEIPHLNNIEHRQPYEKSFNQIRAHFHKAHHYIPIHYYASRYSMVGIILGLLLAILTSYLITKTIHTDALLIGSIVGLAIGYLWGSYKEIPYRKAKKII